MQVFTSSQPQPAETGPGAITVGTWKDSQVVLKRNTQICTLVDPSYVYKLKMEDNNPVQGPRAGGYLTCVFYCTIDTCLLSRIYMSCSIDCFDWVFLESLRGPNQTMLVTAILNPEK